MKQIGRYQIRKETGRGGMSVVYEAFDPHFKRAVAVKVMTRELLDDPKLIARFEREAQTIAALEHPAIVPVYDFGEDEQRPYLVMRLMTGGTLAERLQNGPLSVSATAQILNRIGSTLERAHEQGVVHRDLKPSNIMFDQYGDAYLADFGIARLTEGAENLTGENVIGTPAYMSPEQIHGDQTIDGRSDIYALGVICFEMLTGRRPFEEKAPARLMMQHLIDPVPDIREVRPDLPPGVELVISRSMAKSPGERYADAGELTDTLNSLVPIAAAAAAAAPLPDAAAPIEAVTPPPSAGESDEIEATILDSGELMAQVSTPEPIPTPTPQPRPAAIEKEANGRKKWVITGTVVFGILAIILAAVFWEDIFTPGESETMEVIDTPTDVAEIAAQEAIESPPESAGDAQDTAVPDPQATAEFHLDRFFASMDAEDYETAAEAIDQAIALLSEEGWLHAEKARLHEETGDLESAIAEIMLTIELEPEYSNHHARLGSLLREQDDLEAALGSFLRAEELSPDDPYLHMELGETFKLLDDPGMALEHYNRALSLKKDEAWFYDARADIYIMLGDYELALADLERASELEPEQRGFYTRAGDIFLNDVQDPERALDYFNLAVERSPDEGWVYADRAIAFDALGNIDAAMVDLDRAIELDPDNAYFYIRRSQLYQYGFEDNDAALADLNRAVEIDPENPDAYAERASFYQYSTGNMDAALEDHSRALALDPERSGSYADRALVYLEMGRAEEALADLHRCLELEPQQYWCAWERALLFDNLGNKTEAAANFQRFLDHAPEDDCPECHEEAERYIADIDQ